MAGGAATTGQGWVQGAQTPTLQQGGDRGDQVAGLPLPTVGPFRASSTPWALRPVPRSPGGRRHTGHALCPAYPCLLGVGAVGHRHLPQALQPIAYLPSLQPTAQGAFLRGSGLSLASGRFTAPVTAIFHFSASLHVGEWGQATVGVGVGAGPPRWAPTSQAPRASCCSPGFHWGPERGLSRISPTRSHYGACLGHCA